MSGSPGTVRKQLLGVALALALAGGMTACGSSGTSTHNPGKSPTTKKTPKGGGSAY
jgi:hypothetical protein